MILTRSLRAVCGLSWAVLFATACAGRVPRDSDADRTAAYDTLTGAVALTEAPQQPLARAVGAAFVGRNLVVADGGANNIRIYDVDGNLLRVLGRQGDGPGEFDRLQWIQALHSLIYAYDGALDRISVYDSSGALQRTIPIRSIDSVGLPAPVGVFADGSLLATIPHPLVRVPRAIEVVRDTYPLVRLDRDGGYDARVGSFVASEYVNAPYGHGGGSIWPAYFWHRSSLIVTGADFIQSAGGISGIARRDKFGAALSPAWRPPQDTLLPLRDADVERARAALLLATNERAVKELFDRTPMPRLVSKFGVSGVGGAKPIQVSSDGSVWIHELRSTQGWDMWTVCAATGAFIARVRVPAGMALLAIAPGRLLGQVVDSTGEEHLVLAHYVLGSSATVTPRPSAMQTRDTLGESR